MGIVILDTIEDLKAHAKAITARARDVAVPTEEPYHTEVRRAFDGSLSEAHRYNVVPIVEAIVHMIDGNESFKLKGVGIPKYAMYKRDSASDSRVFIKTSGEIESNFLRYATDEEIDAQFSNPEFAEHIQRRLLGDSE